MTNTEKATKILQSGDLSYSAWKKIEKLIDTAERQDKYQCQDIASAFISSGGDTEDIEGINNQFDADMANILK